MSHLEHCVFCYDAVLDVDDGENVIKNHVVLHDKFCCYECVTQLSKLYVRLA